MTKDKLEEMVERVTEAILREARENGADSPMDRGDAEQLAIAALNASGLIAERDALREALERLVGFLRQRRVRLACKDRVIGDARETLLRFPALQPSDTGATE